MRSQRAELSGVAPAKSNSLKRAKSDSQRSLKRSSDSRPSEGGLAAKKLRRTFPISATTSYALHPKLQFKESPPDRGSDKDGHYCFKLGDNLTRRYKILGNLGQGTFGKVVTCWDRLEKAYVAIKIIRRIPKYRRAAMFELQVLDNLRQADPSGNMHCIQLKEWFDYRSHPCLVFVKLGPNLFQVLQRRNFVPFGLACFRSFALQLLQAVSFMHAQKITHTDLKPDNILIPDPAPGVQNGAPDAASLGPVPISLIDFGSAVFDDDRHPPVVSTRQYRAPEVILGIKWSYPCDMWSIGCLLSELVTGRLLFNTHDSREHLAMMELVLGPFPKRVSSTCRGLNITTDERKSEFGVTHPNIFDPRGRVSWPLAATPKDRADQVMRLAPLSEQIAAKCAPGLKQDPGLLPSLVDLIRRMLHLDQHDRITADEALGHEFFTRAPP